jgi:hypothetical protein
LEQFRHPSAWLLRGIALRLPQQAFVGTGIRRQMTFLN